MREEEFRRKVTWFSFLFSVLVVWAHSFNAELFMGDTAAGERLNSLERMLGDVGAQIAVPGFFMISGYLFYRNFSWNKLEAKWESRIRSVLVPYIVWNTLYYLAYAAGSRLPGIGDLIGKGEIPFHIRAFADAVLNHTYLYAFWYLYQLILLIMLAPLLYGLLKRPWTAAIYFGALLVILWNGWDLTALNGDALFYYSAAAYLGVHKEKLPEKAWSFRGGAAGLGFIGAAVLCYQTAGRTAMTFFVVLYRFFMVSGLWLLIPEKWLKEPREWMHYNFFLYAIHFALVRLVNKSGAALFHRFFPVSGGSGPEFWPAALIPLALYLLMPALMVIISYWTGKNLKRFCPALFGWLNGGR